MPNINRQGGGDRTASPDLIANREIRSPTFSLL